MVASFLEQVYEFVQLSELYYAGSHGMDIMGPANNLDGFRVKGTKSRDKKVNAIGNLLIVSNLLSFVVLIVTFRYFNWPMFIFSFSRSCPCIEDVWQVIILLTFNLIVHVCRGMTLFYSSLPVIILN